MDALLVINPRAGDETPAPEELRAEAERRKIEARVLAPGQDAGEVARSSDAAVLGIAGGDGTLGAVAEVAIERGIPWVCVPYGTRNHFARDLGLDPDDPLAALGAFRGRETRVDVGRVNGRVFLNNVSLGPYARLVHEQRRLRTVRALLLAVRGPRPPRLRIDGRPSHPRAVLVASNAYSGVGRDRLNEGMLHLYEGEGLLPRTWKERAAKKIEIDAARTLEAAVDGEPAQLEPPLELTIEPGALRVLLPGEPS